MTTALILLAAVLVILAVGGYVFCTACCRKPEPKWTDREELEKTPYGRYYDHILAAHNWLQSQKTEDVFVQSYDGLKLHGTWVPAQKPRGTILLVHGYHSGILADFGPVFDFYHDLGLNLLLPDQRCHGKSEGKYTTFGVKESRDMLCWLRWHNEAKGEWEVILSGLSMGASTVMYLMDEDLPDNVKGVIADCGFTSPKEILDCVFESVTHLPPMPWLWGTELFARLLAGFSLTEKSSLSTLKANRLPIFLVHGKADDFVPCNMTERAFEACAGDKRLLIVEGAGHATAFLKDRETYVSQIMALLHTALEENHELRDYQKL